MSPSPRTFAFEDTLPRVPLPDLDHTCNRFLEWCAPLLTAAELADTEESVAQFLAPGSPAYGLQEALAAYDGSPDVQSWLDEFWRDRYLGRRDRIALNANFFFLFRDDRFGALSGQVDRAAALVAAALELKSAIDDEQLAPAEQRGQPLSMAQFRHLFSTTRIPGHVRDTVRTPYSQGWPGPSAERHIVVFHRGHMFRLDVIGPDGVRHSVPEIAAGLRAIQAASETPAAPGTSVGQLTTKARAEWAASRDALLAGDPSNAAALDTVERALLCLALEGDVPRDAQDAGDRLLAGDSANRWFDKGVTLVVFGDGTAGVNGEHCELDGTTLVAFVDAIMAAAPELPAEDARHGECAFAPIEFVLDAALRADVTAAGEAFAAYAAATATTNVTLDDFGANDAKQLGFSPDAFVQLAFQLAHQRAKGRIGATYESIATRRFRAGRTEAMRVVTPESARFVEVMADPGTDRATRLAAFRAAAQAHVARAHQCQGGDAPEQHLWELEMIQRRQDAGAEPPALYASPGWTVMRDDYLSTSAVTSPNITFFGFGSTSEKCIGVAYVLRPEHLAVFLSTPEPVAEQMAVFAAELPRALAELRELATEPEV